VRRLHLQRFRTVIVGGVLAATVASACASAPGKTTTTGGLQGDPGNCVTVDMAISPEKVTVLTELANTFNDSKTKINGKCIFVRPAKKASGGAAQLLVQGWPDPANNGPQPVIWSPASNGWAGVVNEQVGKVIAPPGTPFMLTPLVIAMPKTMAEALGYPNKQLGFSDIVALANNPQGWAAYGHPEWGAFKLGKTNPNFSTSGLNFTIAEYYAATGKTKDLTVEDLQRPNVADFAAKVEQSVVHYGDTTLTFLNNWYRADQRGNALAYASAVAVEEKSVIDYNTGNPDGILDPGEVPRPPRDPLVAIYPKEGTLFSDNPFIILDADWVSDDQRAAAKLFQDFVQQPENQAKVLQFGFRPGNPNVAVGDPISAKNGVDPSQPQSELQVPQDKVLVGVLKAWGQQRKDAKVLLVLDVSGSMGEGVGTEGKTKLDLAIQAAVNSLGKFKDTDEVGLWIFTTDLGTDGTATYLELVPTAPMSENRAKLKSAIEQQRPLNGTPLYSVTKDAFEAARAGFDPSKINAVVFLTDGQNDDGTVSDDSDQYNDMLTALTSGSEGVNSKSVRVFTISYGADADSATLKAIAEATNAAYYDASNPATIDQVFTNVVSNF
jgi:Ca-activated chloride channel family protein